MLIILFNLIIILAFANMCYVDDDPKNKWTIEWKEEKTMVFKLKRVMMIDDKWNAIRLNIKQGDSSLTN